MIGKCFCTVVVFSVVFSFFCGTASELANGAIDGAAKAVELVISLCGMMCLWCGVMNVFKEAGIIEKFSRLLSPILRHVFPTAFKQGIAKEEITSAVSANILGIGNAATPFALSAMKKMEPYAKGGIATNDMIMLSVLACSSLDILPTTLITLRRGAGSVYPYKIIVPVWICSFTCALLAVIFCRAFGVINAKRHNLYTENTHNGYK